MNWSAVSYGFRLLYTAVTINWQVDLMPLVAFIVARVSKSVGASGSVDQRICYLNIGNAEALTTEYTEYTEYTETHDTTSVYSVYFVVSTVILRDQSAFCKQVGQSWATAVFYEAMHMVNSKWRRRIRWGAIVVVTIVLLVTVVIWRIWTGRYVAQWQMLQNVSQWEQNGVDRHGVQPLGWNLAILGRDDEIRRMDFHPLFELPPLDVDTQQLELHVVPWRDAFKQIADEHRIVMIMEDHFVSKHREMIGAALPILRDAGFTHYAAEAIGESAESLRSRGYPIVETGYYTSDPQFGNAIRRAIELRFEVLGYDFRPFTHEGREEFAATTLADVLSRGSHVKLVVHAGLAHVLKHKTDLGQRWLASILWEKTGIEPFTVWQWSEMYDGQEYRVVADVLAELGDFEEPVLLMPPPTRKSGLRNVPDVDAILVHPPDQSVAPDARTVLFPDAMHRIAGQWRTRQWPVVIAAYKRGEPTNAIPLDQVMLREGEQDFTLWIPASLPYDIVVFNQNGLVDSSTVIDLDSVLVRAVE